MNKGKRSSEPLRGRLYKLLQICRKQKQDLIHYKETASNLQILYDSAIKLQRELIPRSLPKIINLKVLAFRSQSFGGDYYDVLVGSHQKSALLAFCISSPPESAALFGAAAKLLFVHYIEKYESPALACKYVKQELRSVLGKDGKLSVFLGTIDPLTNMLVYTRSADCVPIVFRSRTEEVLPLTVKNEVQTPVKEKFTEQTMFFNSGDKLLVHLQEANKQFDSAAVSGLFQKNGNRSIKEIVDLFSSEWKRTVPEAEQSKAHVLMLFAEFGSAEELLEEAGFSDVDRPKSLLVKNYDDMEIAVSLILRDMDHGGFPDLSIKQVKICIYEIISNAIRHGNREDFSKNVYLFYKVDSEAVTVSAVDEGDGFDYNLVPNPLEPEYRYRDHGRGLFLIRHYMDEVLFNQKGNRILARKFNDRNRRK